MKKTGVCGRKKRFASEYEAEKKLRRIQQMVAERNTGYAPVRWYWHHACNGFHLTSESYKEDGIAW